MKQKQKKQFWGELSVLQIISGRLATQTHRTCWVSVIFMSISVLHGAPTLQLMHSQSVHQCIVHV